MTAKYMSTACLSYNVHMNFRIRLFIVSMDYVLVI